MFCRIANGVAIDIVPSYEDRFHPSLHSGFVECPDEVETGWVYDSDADKWSAPAAPESDPEA